MCVGMDECVNVAKCFGEKPYINAIHLPLSALLSLMMMTKADGGEEIKDILNRIEEHQAVGTGSIITKPIHRPKP